MELFGGTKGQMKWNRILEILRERFVLFQVLNLKVAFLTMSLIDIMVDCLWKMGLFIGHYWILEVCVIVVLPLKCLINTSN